MIIPIGLDNARLARLPLISFGIAALCILAYLATAFSGNDWEIMAAHGEAVGYLRRHPYLQAPAPLARWQEADAGAQKHPPPPARLSAADLAHEQRELDELAERFTALREADPQYRFSLVPARGLFQLGWLTHLFMHAGIGHLAGNLFFFLLLVGPFLEDAWGRVVFCAFYLVGGLVAAAVEVPMLHPDVALLGASGAISACLGAFALRFAHRRCGCSTGSGSSCAASSSCRPGPTRSSPSAAISWGSGSPDGAAVGLRRPRGRLPLRAGDRGRRPGDGLEQIVRAGGCGPLAARDGAEPGGRGRRGG